MCCPYMLSHFPGDNRYDGDDDHEDHIFFEVANSAGDSIRVHGDSFHTYIIDTKNIPPLTGAY